MKVFFEFSMSSITKCMYRSFFKSPVHSLYLTICPRMLYLSLAMLYLILIANTLKYMSKCIYMMIMVGKLNPIICKNLSTFYKFSNHIRKLIYTTNPIEGFHRQLRKYTKTKAAFTSENALLKLAFAAILRISEKMVSAYQ
jgi:hypothetical protein